MKYRVIKYEVVFIIIYLIFAILTSVSAITMARNFESVYSNIRYAYYWMNYKVAFISFANNMLVISGIISVIFGSFLPKYKKKRENIEFAIIYNFIYSLLAATTTFLMLFLFTDRYTFSVDFNIIYRSICMIIGFYMYIMFWTLFSYGVRETLRIKFIIAPLLIFEQVFEIIYLVRMNIFKFNSILPTSMSRELVIQQFPFWKSESWASMKGVFHYGNISMMHNQYYVPTNVSSLWVYFVLFLYICLAYALPLLKKEKNSDKSKVSISG
jgi:hypothetical protein